MPYVCGQSAGPSTAFTIQQPRTTSAQLRLDKYTGFHYIGGMADKPMTGQAFFVLTALADEPRHGYGIVGEVAELSGGRVRLRRPRRGRA